MYKVATLNIKYWSQNQQCQIKTLQENYPDGLPSLVWIDYDNMFQSILVEQCYLTREYYNYGKLFTSLKVRFFCYANWCWQTGVMSLFITVHNHSHHNNELWHCYYETWQIKDSWLQNLTLGELLCNLLSPKWQRKCRSHTTLLHPILKLLRRMGLQLVVTCVILHADHRQLVILTRYYSALGNNFLFFKTVELYRISVTLM